VDEEGGAEGLRAKEEREEEERKVEKMRKNAKKAAKQRGRSKIGNKMAANERQL